MSPSGGNRALAGGLAAAVTHRNASPGLDDDDARTAVTPAAFAVRAPERRRRGDARGEARRRAHRRR